MLRIQLIVNSEMRLIGAEKVAPGGYVLADEWKVIEPIGKEFECTLLTRVAKAINIDYKSKEITVRHDIKNPTFEAIVKLSKKPYDPEVGYYWGIDAIVLMQEEYYSWFFCTNSTRFLLENLPAHKRYRVSSELIDDRYWIPKLELTNDLAAN
jgi:hypothetical protein